MNLPRRVLVAVASVVAVGAVILAVQSPPSAGAAPSGTVGTALPVSPGDLTTPVSGASTATFSFQLSPTTGQPKADCSADSATGATTVDSYLVKQGTDPSTLTFTGGQPSSGLFLPDQNDAAAPFLGATTAPHTGQVLQSTFGWAPSQLAKTDLLYNGATDGTASIWETGLACDKATSSGDVVTDYWNAQVTFTAASSDPNGFTWTAAALADPSAGTSGGTTTTTTTAGSGSSTGTSSSGSSSTGATSSGGSSTAGTSAAGTATGATGNLVSSSDPASDPASASGASGDPASSTGSLATTGAALHRELNVALIVAWCGVCLVLISAVGAAGVVRQRRRSSP